MKFYQAEMEMFEFAKGKHPLREWADYGFNKVVFNKREFYDGRLEEAHLVRKGYNPELELDYFDFDEDGFRFAVLKKVSDNK